MSGCVCMAGTGIMCRWCSERVQTGKAPLPAHWFSFRKPNPTVSCTLPDCQTHPKKAEGAFSDGWRGEMERALQEYGERIRGLEQDMARALLPAHIVDHQKAWIESRISLAKSALHLADDRAISEQLRGKLIAILEGRE